MDPTVAAEIEKRVEVATAEVKRHYETEYEKAVAHAKQDVEAAARQSVGLRAQHSKPEKFSGKATMLLDFLFKVELYLAAVGIAETSAEAVNLGVGYLEGAALTWWRYRTQQVRDGQQVAITTWATFREVITAQFRALDEGRLARDKLKTLRQLGGVRDYAQRFQTLMLDLPNMHEDDKVWSFCSGLKPGVRVLVELARPKNLLHAIQLADTSDTTMYLNRHPQRATARAYEEPVAMELGAMTRGADGGRRGRRNGRTGHVEVPTPRDLTNVRCYGCGRMGHLKRTCPGNGRPGNRRA